mmetsp:Transcript_11642/g.35089  ORF Transcript_11642/g.35089 Transcript_11642/m.35089 type:complete len:200 (+) Transcript_11642:325-924(+)
MGAFAWPLDLSNSSLLRTVGRGGFRCRWPGPLRMSWKPAASHTRARALKTCTPYLDAAAGRGGRTLALGPGEPLLRCGRTLPQIRPRSRPPWNSPRRLATRRLVRRRTHLCHRQPRCCLRRPPRRHRATVSPTRTNVSSRSRRSRSQAATTCWSTGFPSGGNAPGTARSTAPSRPRPRRRATPAHHRPTSASKRSTWRS